MWRPSGRYLDRLAVYTWSSPYPKTKPTAVDQDHALFLMPFQAPNSSFLPLKHLVQRSYKSVDLIHYTSYPLSALLFTPAP